ncbi:MAG: TonB-dependent receptor [Acidobacteria bacterium]|nr:TonB-dependent receptor [Acidobacteriota bacterium]
MSLPAAAQVMDGRVEVRTLDASDRGVPAAIELVGRNPEFLATAVADDSGVAVLQRIPPGLYQLRVSHAGFKTADRQVEVRSAVPVSVEVKLAVEAVREEVTVESSAPLLDPTLPSDAMRAGRNTLDRALGTTLGRSTIDVVTTMPGWLLEANAVLHPRGSEYDTQYVIDGMPVYDNRSIAFAPAFENSEFEAVSILTAGIPAEYGRRLGGVIALDTRRAAAPGNHSELDLKAGSYDTQIGSFSHQYVADRTVVAVGLQGGRTDRYLDPPSLENFTNKGTSGGFNARLEQDLSERDRLSFYLRSNRTSFLTPNDLVQQAAGQRQDRRTGETAGQVHYQRTISSRALGSVRGMVRDLSSELWSNTLSTPVYVQQDRGFREGAVIADLTVEGERHTLKLGGDLRINDIREQFQLAEPDELPELDLDFRDNRRSTEVGLFVQDHIRLGNFAANLGVRFDRYSLLVEDNAISPRVALSYYVRPADLQLYASYDRIFQPPPMENLLLSSGAAGLGIDQVEDALPVSPSRANFFEVGLRKPLAGALYLDANHYWRTFRNYIDDDVFLNTGISFPITFDTARIEGTEVRLEMPRWKGLSSFVSYSNMMGRASSPVTGGLFIQGGEAEELREGVEHFPISQDQRNTVAMQVSFEPHPRVWVSAGARYGSGLPVELEDDDDDDDDDDGDGDDGDDDDGDDDDHGPQQLIPQAILDKVNFERGRIRPNFSLDFSVGARVWAKDQRSLTLQFDVRNAANRLNVINFSGLFSGTALAPGRQVTVQLKLKL